MENVPTPANSENARQVVTDATELKQLIITAIQQAAAKGLTDAEGFVDCKDIGNEIAEMQKKLPKKLGPLLQDFAEDFETRPIKKGKGTALVARQRVGASDTEDTETPATDEPERQVVTDADEVKQLLITAMRQAAAKGLIDDEGFVDCMVIGAEIAAMQKKLPKKFTKLFQNYPVTFESRSIQKGNGTVLVARMKDDVQTPASDEPARQVVTDATELKQLIITAIQQAAAKGLTDAEGFVDCKDIGLEIATMQKKLPRKLVVILPEFADDIEAHYVQKGKGTALMVRQKADAPVAPKPITRDILAEAYSALPKLKPLGFRDFDKFLELVGQQMGRPVGSDELRATLMRFCPKAMFFVGKDGSCYKSAEGDIANAFKANELQPETPTPAPVPEPKPTPAPEPKPKPTPQPAPAQPVSPTPAPEVKKDVLKDVYATLEAYPPMGFRDLALFQTRLSQKLGREVSDDELRRLLKKACPAVRFWKNYRSDVTSVTIAQAFRADALKRNAIEELLAIAVFPGERGYQRAINQLAEKALPEKWYYGKTPDPNHPILSNYFLLTFQRLRAEDREHEDDPLWKKKIRVSTGGDKLLFNTGLVDKLYEPVYAYFTRIPNRNSGRTWMFAAFVGSRDSLHQELTRSFGTNLPEPAHYYNNTSELIYDIKSEIGSYNWDHFIDNCARLPMPFLTDNISDFDFSQAGKPDFHKRLAEHIKADVRCYNRIKNRIEDAIAYSLKRVRWNFKTAIPIYYPGQRQISLLLPLALTGGPGSEHIDVALVLESTENGAYIAHTILTLQMAYTNARLITRPDSDWLTSESITDVRADAEFED